MPLICTYYVWTLQNGFVIKDLNTENFFSISTVGKLIIDHIAQRIPSAVNLRNIELRKSTII
jgi:hypothetical protein